MGRKYSDPNKRVNIILVKDIQEGHEEDGNPIIIKAGERMLRTTRSFAERLIAETNGAWAYSSKKKLKSFLNKELKLHHNMRTLDQMQNITGETFPEKQLDGKVIAVVPTFRIEPEEPVRVTRKVRVLIEKRGRGASGVQSYRKSDKSRFQFVTVERTFKYKPNKATLAKRKENDKKTRLVGTGKKLIILGY